VESKSTSVKTKTCNRCRATKPLEEFPEDKRALDGISITCQGCRASALETKLRVPKAATLKKPGGLESLLLTLIVSIVKRINKVGISNNDIKSICSLSKEYREHRDITAIGLKATKHQQIIELICERKGISEAQLESIIEEIKDRGLLPEESSIPN